MCHPLAPETSDSPLASQKKWIQWIRSRFDSVSMLVCAAMGETRSER